LRLSRAREAKSEIAIANANLGALALLLGDLAQASAYLTEGQQIFAEQGDKRLEAECLALLGMLFEQMGEDGKADAFCQRTLQLAKQQRYYHPQREAWITLGHLRLRQGQLNMALTAYQQANTLSQAVGVAEELLQGQVCLAAVLLAQNEPGQALTLVEKVLQQFNPARFNPFQSPQRMLLTCYDVLAANHDARAGGVLQQAWALLQAQAAKISDERLRQSFLENVPVNHTLVKWITASQPVADHLVSAPPRPAAKVVAGRF
jgi:tetratricopeptide (TPR) repeat protein